MCVCVCVQSQQSGGDVPAAIEGCALRCESDDHQRGVAGTQVDTCKQFG